MSNKSIYKRMNNINSNTYQILLNDTYKVIVHHPVHFQIQFSKLQSLFEIMSISSDSKWCTANYTVSVTLPCIWLNITTKYPTFVQFTFWKYDDALNKIQEIHFVNSNIYLLDVTETINSRKTVLLRAQRYTICYTSDMKNVSTIWKMLQFFKRDILSLQSGASMGVVLQWHIVELVKLMTAHLHLHGVSISEHA